MASKFFPGLRRDFLAKELLQVFLHDPSVMSKLMVNDEAKYVDPNFEDGVLYEDLLVSRCISLTNKLIKGLAVTAGECLDSSNEDSDYTNDFQSPVVLDGDLE